MSKLLALVGSWGLFYVGDVLSKIGEGFLDSYYWCMRKSLHLQEKYDVEGPWVDMEETNERFR